MNIQKRRCTGHRYISSHNLILKLFKTLYLFVHFPTDVLFGAALGVALALATVKLQRLALAGMKKRREAHRE